MIKNEGIAEGATEQSFAGYDKVYHIKDLERVLYQEVQRLGIRIEHKKFVSLYQDLYQPGLVVSDEKTQQHEVIRAEFVFDCTGQKRSVIWDVNQKITTQPFQLVDMCDVAVKNHMLAYIRMTPSAFETLDTGIQSSVGRDDDEAYTASLLQLRQLGWQEFKYPRLYMANFGKNKVCLYLHAPEGLAPENADLWLKSVLACYAQDIAYEHLPPSKKYRHKPRFGTFTMSTQMLNCVSYQDEKRSLPMVVALGDAQIDFDYYLAHGVHDGLQRIDALLEHIVVYDKKIQYFDAQEYSDLLQQQLREHSVRVVAAQKKVLSEFTESAQMAIAKLQRSLQLPRFADQQQPIHALLEVAKVRGDYATVLQGMQQLPHSGQLYMLANLTVLRDGLVKVWNKIALIPQHETQMIELMKTLAIAWKEEGNAAYKNQKYPAAIKAYADAIVLLQYLPVQPDSQMLLLTLYSNQAVTCKANQDYPQAIAYAQLGIGMASTQAVPQKLAEKLIYQLMIALCARTTSLLAQNRPQEAYSSYQDTLENWQQLQQKLAISLRHTISNLVNELKLAMPVETSVDALSECGCIDSTTASTCSVTDVEERLWPVEGTEKLPYGFFVDNKTPAVRPAPYTGQQRSIGRCLIL